MISVVIPIYNTEKYLHECLQSVQDQTFTDFEVVMVNDGSTDTSADIASQFSRADSRFRLVNKPNDGPSAARNKGIEESKGEYIVFLDSDDTLHPDALKILISALEDCPGSDIVITEVIQTQIPCFKTNLPFRQVLSEDLLKDTLYQKAGTNNSATGYLVKKDTILKTGLFTEGIFYEDLELFPRLMERSRKVAISRNILFFYRTTSDSRTQKWTPRRLDALDVTDCIERAMRPCGKGLLRAAQSRRFSAHYNMFLLSTANGYTAGADRCWPVIRRLRLQMLIDPRVRLKNKAGALIALFGRRFASLFAKRFAGK